MKNNENLINKKINPNPEHKKLYDLYIENYNVHCEVHPIIFFSKTSIYFKRTRHNIVCLNITSPHNYYKVLFPSNIEEINYFMPYVILKDYNRSHFYFVGNFTKEEIKEIKKNIFFNNKKFKKEQILKEIEKLKIQKEKINQKLLEAKEEICVLIGEINNE